MNEDARAESSPAKRSRRAAVKTNVPDEGELAARLFVNLYQPGGGRTAEHYAQQAIEAAEVFLQTYQEHHR